MTSSTGCPQWSGRAPARDGPAVLLPRRRLKLARGHQSWMTSSWSLTRVLIATTRAHDSHQFAPHRRHDPNGWRVLPFGVPVNANGARWCSGSRCAPFFFAEKRRNHSLDGTLAARGVFLSGVRFRTVAERSEWHNHEHDQTSGLTVLLSGLQDEVPDRADGIAFHWGRR